MVTVKGRREVSPPDTAAHARSSDELASLTRCVVEAGVSIAMVPVNMLPAEPRQHVKTAGRELIRALASLTRSLADNLERLSRESDEKTR